jgi:hypothetical protein
MTRGTIRMSANLGLSLGVSFGYHHLGPTGGASSTFTEFGSAEVGVVHVDQDVVLIVGIRFGYCMAKFVAHGPHSFVVLDFQHPLERQPEDAAILLSHEPDYPEPFGKRRSGLVEHSACSQRS